MSELPKTFDPAAIEAKWYAHWESTGAFRPARAGAEPYTIVMPPPNVTGSLHIGHALDNTLQDILIRHARLQGKDALWVVGTDHAGIATQMVVERQMNERQQKRTHFTRDEFIDKVWEWKAESGGTITRQLRRLGASCDWTNERFTMDEGFSKAVIKVFVDLYNQGLLYRDKRLVNWDPGLKTAISDLEVENKETFGEFWHFKYPLADGPAEDGMLHITVATTRPETMLADMAVAVHPEDERYKSLIGKRVKLPITGRLIPIIADEHADPELGSGAVKITPGHDFNDFEVGKRAGYKASEMLNMLDADANVCQTADGLVPEEYIGLDRFEARKLIAQKMEQDELLAQYMDTRPMVLPLGDRSGVVIEPWLTDQWYVDAETLAKPAIEAVRSGAIKVVPQTWEKTYFNWMENIQPWCVSRQLWWGHRIPVWYGPHTNAGLLIPSFDTTCIVATDESELRQKALEIYGDREIVIATKDEAAAYADNMDQRKVLLWQDNDVLDTWFSSALWPFGTLGWPEQPASPPAGEAARLGEAQPNLVAAGEGDTPSADGAPDPSPSLAPLTSPSPARGEGGLLQRHYPNDVLISGFDILFFWDARMIMQGLHFMKEAPFKTLYLHGLVRAADGSKMSKSKGNTVDPLGLIDQYGADALRFTLTAMESQGRDIKLDEKRVEGYRNFATKLWNAARFCQANGIGASTSVAAPAAELAVNRWIIGEVVETLAKLDQAITDLRFDAMADAIYHFAWGTFCDWYLELIKPAFVDGEKGEMDAESKLVAGWVFDQILVMLHPFMPFITEELWASMGERECGLIHARWPEPKAELNADAKAEIEWIIGLVGELRSMRVNAGIASTTKVTLEIRRHSEWQKEVFVRYGTAIKRLANLASLIWFITPTVGEGVYEEIEVAQGDKVQLVYDDMYGYLDVEAPLDQGAERTRLNKALESATKERDSLAGRLNNPAFVEKAKPEAVEKARADHAEKAAEAERLAAALARLG